VGSLIGDERRLHLQLDFSGGKELYAGPKTPLFNENSLQLTLLLEKSLQVLDYLHTNMTSSSGLAC
jgi:hypothetical protein